MNNDILIEHIGAVQIIRLNRMSKKNAITSAMYAAMSSALRTGDNNENIRAHVLFGQPGVFSAGNDMQDFMQASTDGRPGDEIIDFLSALSQVRKPIIAGVDGLAIGIGTTMLFHCDLTFATPRSLFRTPFVDLGLVPEAGSSLLAPRIMGKQKAFALLALGRAFTAEASQEAGIVFEIVDEEQLEAQVLQTATEIAAKPSEAMRITRELLRLPEETLSQRISREADFFEQRLHAAEAKEAFTAFFKRKR